MPRAGAASPDGGRGERAQLYDDDRENRVTGALSASQGLDDEGPSLRSQVRYLSLEDEPIDEPII
jgi:hypothetical protein